MFTKEQIDEIIKKIKQESIKDTELPSTDTLSTSDVVPIVQNGSSKKTTIGELADLMTELNANNFKGAYDTEEALSDKYPNPEDRDYAWVWNGIYDVQLRKIYTFYLTRLNEDGVTYSWYNTGIIASAVIIDDTFNIESSNGLQNGLITKRFEDIENTVFPASMTLTISEVNLNTNFKLSWIVKDGNTTITNSNFTEVKITSDSSSGTRITLKDDAVHIDNYTVVYTRDFKYTVNIKFIDGRGVTREIEKTVTFSGFRYKGVIDSSETITEQKIILFGRDAIPTSKGATFSYTLNNQKAVYVYPKAYGLLTAINDSNGLNLMGAFTQTELTVEGILCYVYTQTTASTVTNYSIIFK